METMVRQEIVFLEEFVKTNSSENKISCLTIQGTPPLEMLRHYVAISGPVVENTVAVARL